MSQLEIERKFVVTIDERDFDRDVIKRDLFLRKDFIHQFYLYDTNDVEVRLRYKRGLIIPRDINFTEEFVLTRKRGSGISREEKTIELYGKNPDKPLLAYYMLLHDDPNPPEIIKDRYTYKNGWEVDVYSCSLYPLQIVEIELESEDEELPELPSFISVVKEVTDDPRFKNRNLAKMERSEVDKLLEECYIGNTVGGITY